MFGIKTRFRMKLTAFLFAFLAAAISCCGETGVSAVQDGHALSIDGSTAEKMEKLAGALLVSCNYEAPSEIATAERWQQALLASHVHITFSEPATFTFRFSTLGVAKEQKVSVAEILLPISSRRSPDYVLVWWHDRVRAFAKYRDTGALVALQKTLEK
jgi:hypothetical protein